MSLTGCCKWCRRSMTRIKRSSGIWWYCPDCDPHLAGTPEVA